MYLFKKKKHAPAFNLTQLARFPYKSEREPIKLQSLYKLINHHVVIKRLFHHQTGNLRQFEKKTNYETIKDHNFQNEYQLRTPSISVYFYHEEIQCERNAGVLTWNIVITMYMFLIG